MYQCHLLESSTFSLTRAGCFHLFLLIVRAVDLSERNLEDAVRAPRVELNKTQTLDGGVFNTISATAYPPSLLQSIANETLVGLTFVASTSL